VTRADALAAALKIVDEIAPRKNDRGYADGTIRPGERVEITLRIADWLLDDEADLAAAVNRLTETNPEAARALASLFRTEPAQ
jgi:hypothetical protein